MDKVLCKRLMKSIPARLKAVIVKEGLQVRSEIGKINCLYINSMYAFGLVKYYDCSKLFNIFRD